MVAVSVARLTVAVSTPGSCAGTLDAVDARCAGHALDREGDLGSADRWRWRRVVILPGSISRGEPCARWATRRVCLDRDHRPARGAPSTSRSASAGIVAVAWLTTAEAFDVAPGAPPRPVAAVADDPDRRRTPTPAARGPRAARGRPGRHRPPARSRSTCATGRPGTGGPGGGPRHPVGRDRAATARSPGGSARRGAARAVGGAVGRNPISLLIPCHRVIAADGTLGGYGGDGWGGREERLAIKRDLLLREGVTVAPSRG